MANKTHYVATLKQDLAEEKARNFLTGEAITRLQVYLESEKFSTDTTVETSDVLRRLQNDVKHYLTLNFDHTFVPQFIFHDGMCYVDFPNVRTKLNKLSLSNGAELYVRYEGAEYPSEGYSVPGKGEADVYDTVQTIRMSIFTAMSEGML